MIRSFRQYLFGLTLMMSACHSDTEKESVKAPIDTTAIRKSVADVPVLSPEQSINTMKLEAGLKVELVAAEPLVQAPVAMVFDGNARIWVVEMTGYMPRTDGKGEEIPSGRIVILQDTNRDGRMDTRTVFLDNLLLPRAICLVDDGILVAEPPSLLFYQIRQLRPGKKSVVDNRYAYGGNPEHQPNGLFRALDNWIYSANGDTRYRRSGERWLKEKTPSRGQWGISQDNFGRLFYNNNSENLLGDYFAPSLVKNAKNISGFNVAVVDDNSVFPSRPTPGINRGYMKGMLDDSLRLRYFTAACGPLVYRGAALGDDYQGNAFVAEPSANLIKRNMLTDSGFRVTGHQAYRGHEFLSSSDERFRPVSLYDGPDGALYIVDMHRGIIQHQTYLTDYLKNEINSRSLTQPLNCGRIYRVIKENRKNTAIIFPQQADSLLAFLSNTNGWIRDKAQQLIVDGKDRSIVTMLRKNLVDAAHQLTAIHSFWTLEGLGSLQTDNVLLFLRSPDWSLRTQAITAIPSVMNKKNLPQLLSALDSIIDSHDTIAAPWIGFISRKIQILDSMTAKQLRGRLATSFPKSFFVAASLRAGAGDSAGLTGIRSDTKKKFPAGYGIFQTVCQTCHGADGNGIASLAPPLNGSAFVTGSKDRLAAIVLYGLVGPVQVAGHSYGPPEISGEMPGIGNNKQFSDQQIAEVLNLIRASWKNTAQPLSKEDIGKVRARYGNRQQPFKAEELPE